MLHRFNQLINSQKSNSIPRYCIVSTMSDWTLLIVNVASTLTIILTSIVVLVNCAGNEEQSRRSSGSQFVLSFIIYRSILRQILFAEFELNLANSLKISLIHVIFERLLSIAMNDWKKKNSIFGKYLAFFITSMIIQSDIIIILGILLLYFAEYLNISSEAKNGSINGTRIPLSRNIVGNNLNGHTELLSAQHENTQPFRV